MQQGLSFSGESALGSRHRTCDSNLPWSSIAHVGLAVSSDHPWRNAHKAQPLSSQDLAAELDLQYALPMKLHAAILCAFLFLGMIMNASSADNIRHVVCFKFKSTATADEIKKAEEAFQGLKEKIPQIVSLEWGTNISKEKKDKGFTHCFILTFKSEEDRDAYIQHPAHKAFGKTLSPVIDDVFVIDFRAKD
jgi:hypothetical protein